MSRLTFVTPLQSILLALIYHYLNQAGRGLTSQSKYLSLSTTHILLQISLSLPPLRSAFNSFCLYVALYSS
jgi:hypothetical protein